MKCTKVQYVADFTSSTDGEHPSSGDIVTKTCQQAWKIPALLQEKGLSFDMPFRVYYRGQGADPESFNLPEVVAISSETSTTKAGTQRTMIRLDLPYFRIRNTAPVGADPKYAVVAVPGRNLSAHIVFTLPKEIVRDLAGQTVSGTDVLDVNAVIARAQHEFLRTLALNLANVDGFEVLGPSAISADGYEHLKLARTLDPVTGEYLVPDNVGTSDVTCDVVALPAVTFSAPQGSDPSQPQGGAVSATLNLAEAEEHVPVAKQDILLRAAAGEEPLGNGICAIHLGRTSLAQA